MSLLSRLFGGSSAKEVEPETYNDYRIFVEPMNEGGSYRIGARIEKDIDGETKTHMMIRADSYNALETANEASLSKAQMLIDQQGDRIFD